MKYCNSIEIFRLLHGAVLLGSLHVTLQLLILSANTRIYGFIIPTTLNPAKKERNPNLRKAVENSNVNDYFFAEEETLYDDPKDMTQTRILGSQELLMLPRQYSLHLTKKDSDGNANKPFPQMSHVSTIVLSSTPQVAILSQAIDETMATHPLLRCHIDGDGEPTKRIDLFQMVREGEPNPCTFVSPPYSDVSSFASNNVLSVKDVVGDDRTALDESWMKTFSVNIDGGTDWCDVSRGPLWKVELHRLDSWKKEGTPCALIFTFNHAISDQGSANLLADHIVSNVASIEEGGGISKKSVSQSIPIAMEDSVLGLNNRWSDVQTEGLSLDTAGYVAEKAVEGLKSPVILPDNAATAKKLDGSGLLGALTIISGKAPGGESREERKSTVQFRSLSKDATSALLESCRTNEVTVSNTLSAAIALTSTDFIGNGENQKSKQRNYKVLQSLDMRRFGARLDQSETVACMAGSHDLMLGPLPDQGGLALRNASLLEKKN